MEPPPKQVGIWLRVSTEDQVRGESLDIHEARARSYADMKGWQVAEVYSLGAVSGKKVSDHPEAKRMIADIQSGHISTLIFSKLARLSRNNRELLEFADIFQKANADLVSLAESIDTGTPAGRMFYNMLSAMANWEREEIASRVAASVPIRAKLGKPLGGRTPYGYRWVDKKLVVDPIEAPIRKLIYELYREHKRRRTVARLLNERGLRTRTGAAWSDTSIERNLRDQTAIGKHRVNYTKTADDQTGRVELKPESEWVWREVEPIIEQSLYDECISYMDGLRKSGKRLTRQSVNLFSGFAHCSSCSGKMIVPSQMVKYVCRDCNIRIPMDILEECFISELSETMPRPEDQELRLIQITKHIELIDQLLIAQQATIASVEREIDVLIELYGKGALDEAGFRVRHQKHSERLAELEGEFPRLAAQKDALSISLTHSEQAYEESVDILTRWPTLTRENKRLIIEAVLKGVKISDDAVEFVFYFDPPPIPPSQQSGSAKATQAHGFIAATSCTRAGKVTCALARATLTVPVSSGWRKLSSTGR
jgi:site-specific DNA recombinase